MYLTLPFFSKIGPGHISLGEQQIYYLQIFQTLYYTQKED